MLKHGEVNPLNVLLLRRVQFRMPHFTYVEYDDSIAEKVVSDWLFENLTGRFWIGESYEYDEEKQQLISKKQIGFEIAAEASYYALSQSEIKRLQPIR